MFARDHYTCQICKKKGGILHTHHIIERHKGGSDMAENLVTGFTGKMVYVQDLDGHYIQNPAKSYKQVNISDIECMHHNHNWLFLQVS
ncbi:HNH endonuclease [Bacillus sp. DX4.1]|uniref:HNH endonuclease n=1 Tax=Bacillus sp. DX4.1 TaxID=3055867 RepID=UPI0025A1AFA5|nr:HNH endonuclease [Bacillus sp. DX4.1]MDM5189192.1 HNH endonuclease [Bacillus sp. DX4.1]